MLCQQGLGQRQALALQEALTLRQALALWETLVLLPELPQQQVPMLRQPACLPPQAQVRLFLPTVATGLSHPASSLERRR